MAILAESIAILSRTLSQTKHYEISSVAVIRHAVLHLYAKIAKQFNSTTDY